jgi:hypothetical protein
VGIIYLETVRDWEGIWERKVPDMYGEEDARHM